MRPDELAREIAESLARHQSRGLVDGARGPTDVVIHGRFDLQAVATDMLETAVARSTPANKSWSRWFAIRTEKRRRILAGERQRQAQLDEIENDAVRAAIARLKVRVVESQDPAISP